MTNVKRRAVDWEPKTTYDGAVSATITVKFRSLKAAFKKASTVLECPTVKMISLYTHVSVW